MSEYDEKAELLRMIERMDRVANNLLSLIEGEEGKEQASDAQKGRLYAQVMNWLKMRKSLIPSGEGGRLQEIGNGLKSGSRAGSTGRGPGRPKSTSKDGKAILALTRKVRAIHQRDSNADDTGGDQEDSVGANGGATGAIGIPVPDGLVVVSGNPNEPVHGGSV
jgi:hypothetical protein